jgi:hypothetical protein
MGGAYHLGGQAETLLLDENVSAFAATVSGFGAQNHIDLSEIVFGANTTLVYSENNSHAGGTLSVTDGVNSANIALLGNYIASSFVTASDGSRHGFAGKARLRWPA